MQPGAVRYIARTSPSGWQLRWQLKYLPAMSEPIRIIKHEAIPGFEFRFPDDPATHSIGTRSQAAGSDRKRSIQNGAGEGKGICESCAGQLSSRGAA